jgi:hypothetical protein
MKVKISFTVDIDPKQWADTYGIVVSDVREDVKDYVRSMVITQLAEVAEVAE